MSVMWADDDKEGAPAEDVSMEEPDASELQRSRQLTSPYGEFDTTEDELD